ncbi:MAG TPA: hypothetical protein VHN15_01920, partial [Thermoanaerobaculia bacterium]|nr:hypothetical protein [Thermoanaerobaculia bacterium]
MLESLRRPVDEWPVWWATCWVSLGNAALLGIVWLLEPLWSWVVALWALYPLEPLLGLAMLFSPVTRRLGAALIVGFLLL